jgi:hypothetical protein
MSRRTVSLLQVACDSNIHSWVELARLPVVLAHEHFRPGVLHYVDEKPQIATCVIREFLH